MKAPDAPLACTPELLQTVHLQELIGIVSAAACKALALPVRFQIKRRAWADRSGVSVQVCGAALLRSMQARCMHHSTNYARRTHTSTLDKMQRILYAGLWQGVSWRPCHRVRLLAPLVARVVLPTVRSSAKASEQIQWPFLRER